MPESFSSLLSEIWTQIGLVLTTIAGSFLLLVPVGFKFARKAISATKSLLGTGGGSRRR